MDAFFLSDTYLFRGAAIGDIDSAQSVSEIRDFQGGDTIVGEGEKNQDIMLIVSGRARVQTAAGDLRDELRKGDLFGEIAFLDGRSRTASVVASGPASVLVIPAERLRDLMRKSPALDAAIHRNIALALCERLRESNQQVESMLSPR